MDNGLDKLNYNVGDTIEDLAVMFMDDKSGRNYINGKFNQFFFYTEKAIIRIFVRMRKYLQLKDNSV